MITMKPAFHHMMIGLPEAGKTTYLAALWHVLCQPGVLGALKLARLKGDQSYLNEIREKWSRVVELGRTNPGKEPNLCFHLSNEAGEEMEIHVPDLSGEAFERDWVDRSMHRERAMLFANVSGALLFINPQTLRNEVLISQVAFAVDQLGDDDEEADGDGNTEAEKIEAIETREWKADMAPTQLQLVDLLQIALRLNSRRPFYLAVIVSAWDLVMEGLNPETWVKKELPLLWQFLFSNSSSITSTYFGISAQGGDLKGDGDRLKGIDTPAERIKVVDSSNQNSHDITQPLRWLMTQTTP